MSNTLLLTILYFCKPLTYRYISTLSEIKHQQVGRKL
jgi:hypothetical protein